MTGLALMATMAVAGCQVAAVLFDIPEPAPGPPAVARTIPATTVQDTTTPPIELLADPDSVLALLPKHENGQIDWTAGLRDGLIKPRPGLPKGEVPTYPEYGFDFVMQGSDKMFDANFPHSVHTEWLACKSCHPTVFPYRNVEVTMTQINQGESCGVCHGSVAFSETACGRCHPAMPAGQFEAELTDDIELARAGEVTQAAQVYRPSRFPHWAHRIRYKCSACHPDPFAMQAGTDTLTMADMRQGSACGACHDGNVAFGLLECAQCHVPATDP